MTNKDAMRANIPVSQIMSKELIMLDEQDSLWEAEKTFRDYHLRHAPVVSGGELTGMLSVADLSRVTTVKTGSALTIGQIMTPDPVAVQSDASLKEVAQIFLENEFHAIPVLEGDIIVGIVSTTDLIGYLMDALELSA